MHSFAIFQFNVFQILKCPYLIFKHPFCLKIFSKILNKKNFFFQRIFIILFKLDKSDIEKIFYSSSTFKILTRSFAYKIGLVFGALVREQKNEEIIRKNFPALAMYLPFMSYKNNFVFSSITMPRYQNFDYSEASLVFAKQVLEQFSKYSVMRICSVEEFPHVLRGLKLAKILYPGLNLEKNMHDIFSISWRIGLVHGDFHTKNILAHNNAPIIIDLDHFNVAAMQVLDAFTFLVDFHVSKQKCSWQAAINTILHDKERENLYADWEVFFENDLRLIALLYALNRLGFDNAYYRFLSRSVAKEFAIIGDLIY